MKQKDREIEKELNCVFITTNPDAVDFNMNRLKKKYTSTLLNQKKKN